MNTEKTLTKTDNFMLQNWLEQIQTDPNSNVQRKEVNKEENIKLNLLETKLGDMIIGSTKQGICLVEFADRKNLSNQLQKMQKRFNLNYFYGENKYIQQAKQEITSYLAGNLRTFTVPLHMAGTDFQKRMWKTLSQIPYGKTISYLEQARILGNSKAVRAVANANSLNSIALIIPCHRVIGSNGNLTGYAGGIWRKKRLIQLEQNI